MNAIRILFFVVYCRALELVSSTVIEIFDHNEYPWQSILALDTLDDADFKIAVMELAELAENSYHFPNNINTTGWTFIAANTEDPNTVGMHATVWRDDLTKTRLVIAFRGTSSEADLCADDQLFISKPGTVPIPSIDCRQYSAVTLDYVKQATDYTQEIMRDHPNTSVLLTGHSLGAGLAVLVAARLDTNPLLPVVAFSTPGVRSVLERDKISLSAEQEKRTFSIADQWDEIMRVTWVDQVGKTCLYPTTEPPSCKTCFKFARSETNSSLLQNPVIESKQQKYYTGSLPMTPDCFRCFEITHGLAPHVKSLIAVDPKPPCESHLPQDYLTDANDLNPSSRIPHE